jgi:hypothetical protein
MAAEADELRDDNRESDSPDQRLGMSEASLFSMLRIHNSDDSISVEVRIGVCLFGRLSDAFEIQGCGYGKDGLPSHYFGICCS